MTSARRDLHGGRHQVACSNWQTLCSRVFRFQSQPRNVCGLSPFPPNEYLEGISIRQWFLPSLQILSHSLLRSRFICRLPLLKSAVTTRSRYTNAGILPQNRPCQLFCIVWLVQLRSVWNRPRTEAPVRITKSWRLECFSSQTSSQCCVNSHTRHDFSSCRTSIKHTARQRNVTNLLTHTSSSKGRGSWNRISSRVFSSYAQSLQASARN